MANYFPNYNKNILTYLSTEAMNAEVYLLFIEISNFTGRSCKTLPLEYVFIQLNVTIRIPYNKITNNRLFIKQKLQENVIIYTKHKYVMYVYNE